VFIFIMFIVLFTELQKDTMAKFGSTKGHRAPAKNVENHGFYAKN